MKFAAYSLTSYEHDPEYSTYIVFLFREEQDWIYYIDIDWLVSFCEIDGVWFDGIYNEKINFFFDSYMTSNNMMLVDGRNYWQNDWMELRGTKIIKSINVE